MSVSQSIFGVWRHLRALHALTGRHARNAPKTSRYYGLQGPFWRYFRPKSPLRWTPIRRSRVVFRHNIPDSDEFSPQNHVNNHCEWPNIVSEARIEPLFVENGQKLTSVDQKVVMVMMWWFLTRFNIFFSVELWLRSRNFERRYIDQMITNSYQCVKITHERLKLPLKSVLVEIFKILSRSCHVIITITRLVLHLVLRS